MSHLKVGIVFYQVKKIEKNSFENGLLSEHKRLISISR